MLRSLYSSLSNVLKIFCSFFYISLTFVFMYFTFRYFIQNFILSDKNFGTIFFSSHFILHFLFFMPVRLFRLYLVVSKILFNACIFSLKTSAQNLNLCNHYHKKRWWLWPWHHVFFWFENSSTNFPTPFLSCSSSFSCNCIPRSDCSVSF